jgi:hypothetical protein
MNLPTYVKNEYTPSFLKVLIKSEKETLYSICLIRYISTINADINAEAYQLKSIPCCSKNTRGNNNTIFNTLYTIDLTKIGCVFL